MMHRKNICTYGPSENVEGWAVEHCGAHRAHPFKSSLHWIDHSLWFFLYLIKPLHRKRKIYLSDLTWSPCWDWFCQCFFFYPRQWHTDFWCSQFLLSFLNRILFFFSGSVTHLVKRRKLLSSAPLMAAFTGFYCSQRLRDFQNIFSKDQNQEQMRDVTRALWSPCLPGGRNLFLPYSSTSLSKCGVCKMMLVERCFCSTRLLFYLSCQRIAIALQGI